MACAPSREPRTRSAEVVLERGGELGGELPRFELSVTPALVSVWGITEVPATSRLQAAFAGVDAITRSELLKAIEVRVSAVVTSQNSSEPSRQALRVQTSEVVRGVIASGAPLPHGWARLERDGQMVLRVWARLDVPRASLESALRSTLSQAGQDPRTFVQGLAPVRRDGAESR